MTVAETLARQDVAILFRELGLDPRGAQQLLEKRMRMAHADCDYHGECHSHCHSHCSGHGPTVQTAGEVAELRRAAGDLEADAIGDLLDKPRRVTVSACESHCSNHCSAHH